MWNHPPDHHWLCIYIYYIILYYIILYYHIISYYIISYHIILYYIISYHIKLYYIISYHIILYHIISYYIISYHIISYHIISYYIISYHIILYYIISYHIILYYIISYHIISYHIMLYHIISFHIISYYIISYHIISYHIISYYIIIYLIDLHISHSYPHHLNCFNPLYPCGQPIASGVTWPTMMPWEAPLKRPSVTSATYFPRPAPTRAEPGLNICGKWRIWVVKSGTYLEKKLQSWGVPKGILPCETWDFGRKNWSSLEKFWCRKNVDLRNTTRENSPTHKTGDDLDPLCGRMNM